MSQGPEAKFRKLNLNKQYIEVSVDDQSCVCGSIAQSLCHLLLPSSYVYQLFLFCLSSSQFSKILWRSPFNGSISWMSWVEINPCIVKGIHWLGYHLPGGEETSYQGWGLAWNGNTDPAKYQCVFCSSETVVWYGCLPCEVHAHSCRMHPNLAVMCILGTVYTYMRACHSITSSQEVTSAHEWTATDLLS